MTARINARISDDVARKLERLRRRTGKSTTDILTASIEAYYAKVTEEPVSVLDALGDFVGSGEGPRELSERYKDVLTEEIAKKAQTR